MLDAPTPSSLRAEYEALHFHTLSCGCELADSAGGLVRAAGCPEAHYLQLRKTAAIRRFWVSERKRDSVEYEGMMAAMRAYDEHFSKRGPLTPDQILWVLAIAVMGTGAVALAAFLGWM